MIVETFAIGQLRCNCTILGDEASGEAIVIDGGDGVDEVLRHLSHHRLRAKYLVHTHAHLDHIADLGRLREHTGGLGLLHPDDVPLYHTIGLQAQAFGLKPVPEPVELDGDLRDGDRFSLGGATIEVLHTPGHTPGSVCFALARDNTTPVVFSGDTLFAGSIGRWDLGGTSMEDIVASIHAKLMDYPDATAVVPGHGPATTIGTERATNPYLVRP
ncbi:MAG TPA: MBL fold metallo-hydrolase [Candidatus Baltobacteraceae bacterium]|jgi:glyoxylase-like metal-dependent hydrolase (beta-lactamase superfamily II)|nr:MBL fold metallo-hydrolase [Candidatus Baltobacteraceae bacterium]